MGQIKNIKLHIVTDIKIHLKSVVLTQTAKVSTIRNNSLSQPNQPTKSTIEMADVSVSELACVYSALILYDDDVDITAEKMSKIIAAANVNVEAFWPGLFAKALQGRNIGDLICNVGAAPAAGAGGAAPAGGEATGGADAAEEKKEEKKEDSDESGSDDDMGFGLFD